MELMKSRRLIEQTLLNPVTVNGTTISLAEMYIQFNGWRNNWQKNSDELNRALQFPPGADRSGFSRQQDSVLGNIYGGLLEKNLSIAQRDKKISIITIDVKTESESFSKNFAEILAKEVSDFYIDTKSKKASK